MLNMVQKELSENNFRRMSAEDEEMFAKPSSNASSPARSEVSEYIIKHENVSFSIWDIMHINDKTLILTNFLLLWIIANRFLFRPRMTMSLLKSMVMVLKKSWNQSYYQRRSHFEVEITIEEYIHDF